MARKIMFQGTSSHVGKSILTTAFCRIFKQDGLSVVPFKAQNMALNSYVTPEGGEMGRAQVSQAEAAGLIPAVEMNPILLKPTGNARSQVVVMGRPIGVMSAAEYHAGKSSNFLAVIQNCLKELDERFEVMVIEGAGSPAEVNLKQHDIVNMRIAKLTGAAVFLVADIDRGGAIASVVGTMALLEPDEQKLVKGVILNKFRGDIELLRPAFDVIFEKTGKPVVGVVPYLEAIGVDDEDSVSLDEKKSTLMKELEIVVIRTPRISNFTDFEALSREPDVSLRYLRRGEKLGNPDLLILPGSKNTTEDLQYLKEEKLDVEIKKLVVTGTPIVGICGGYQMLGERLLDPLKSESQIVESEGLCLLPAVTLFAAEKTTHQVIAKASGTGFLSLSSDYDALAGYEIHMGETTFTQEIEAAFEIGQRSGQSVKFYDGAVSKDGLVMGTYLHGIFDNDIYRRDLLNALRTRKGLSKLNSQVQSFASDKERAYDRLADTVRGCIDMAYIRQSMGMN